MMLTFGGSKKYTKKKVKVTDGKAVLDSLLVLVLAVLILDLIQEGCGYPNRNKAWKGVPVQVPSAGQILKGQNSAKNRLSKFETRHTPQTVKF